MYKQIFLLFTVFLFYGIFKIIYLPLDYLSLKVKFFPKKKIITFCYIQTEKRTIFTRAKKYTLSIFNIQILLFLFVYISNITFYFCTNKQSFLKLKPTEKIYKKQNFPQGWLICI